jgi:hypothetical protein
MRRTMDRCSGRPGQALTTEEKLLAVTLRQQGLTHRQIGERLGRARETVCKALREATDASQVLQDKALAKAVLEAAMQQFARDWVQASSVAAGRGNHTPALDALERLGVVKPPVKETAGSGVTVLVGVALPGTPQHSEGDVITLDLSAIAEESNRDGE